MDKILKIGQREGSTSSQNEDNQNSGQTGPDSSSDKSPSFKKALKSSFEKVMIFNDFNTESNNDENPSPQRSPNSISAGLSSGLSGFNKFKDQLAQRALTVIPKPPPVISVPSLFNDHNNNTNEASPTKPDFIFWTEVRIEKAKDLTAKDLNGLSDPYIKVVYGTEEKYTTQVISKNLSPIWNEHFTFYSEDIGAPLYFNVFDRDLIGRDEPMGRAKLELDRLPTDRLYPAILELENESRKDGGHGTLFVSVMITRKPGEFRDEVIRALVRQSSMKSLMGNRGGSNTGVILTRRTIDIFVMKGKNLKPNLATKTCNPFIKFKFGNNKKYRTSTVKASLNPEWNQTFMYDTTMSILPPLELDVFDDCSVSGEFIGRGVCSLADLQEEKTHVISLDLEDDAGTIDMFITITGTTPFQEATNDGESSMNVAMESMPSKLTFDDYRRYRLSSTFQNMKPLFDIGRVEIKIFQARGLSSKDINGKSDPFCVVELDANRLRTHTIYKTLNPVWNKSFVMPVQDIHSVLELKVFDEDQNQTADFLGKVSIPLLAIKNGEKKWMQLKDRKCLKSVKGGIQIEATLVYNKLKAVIRTFKPRQHTYYQTDEKLNLLGIKQCVDRTQNMVIGLVDLVKFIDYCFRWENPRLSSAVLVATIVIIWNFELYMLPVALLLFFLRNAGIAFYQGRLARSHVTFQDETIAAIVPPTSVDEEAPTDDINSKEPKKSFIAAIQSLQDTLLEIQGYIDGVPSTLEKIKNLANFSVPWLSFLVVLILVIGSFVLYYVPLRLLILGGVIYKFTRRIGKPKDFVDNNELVDFMSRLPSDPELARFREIKVVLPTSSSKKKATTTNEK